MKRNRFSLALVPAVSSALLAFGCGQPQQAPPTATTNDSPVCVDSQGRRVPDAQCRDDRPTSRSPNFYHWYHRSYGGAVVPIGGFVGSHSFSHGSSSHPSSVTRGGFGSSAHGHGTGA
ncbi:MAG TPA: hypothetical protein VGS07_21600 [Thermoanaerobaculia bacterium]|nr:hypothetical protein [Thermoanaerobaculia bacterium]